VATSQGERALGIELVIVLLVQIGDAIITGEQGSLGGPKLPRPSRFFATMIAFLFLSGLAAFGQGAAKFAARFGALVTLVILLAPADPTQKAGPGNRPLIMRFLNLLNSYMIAGPISQPGQTSVQVLTPAQQAAGGVNQYGGVGTSYGPYLPGTGPATVPQSQRAPGSNQYGGFGTSVYGPAVPAT